MAVPTYVGAGSPADATGDATPTIHASTTTGDLMVVAMMTHNEEPTSHPSGWTYEGHVGSGSAGTSTGNGAALYWKLHDGSESNPVIGGSHVNLWYAVCFSFRGVDQTTPMDATPVSYNTTSSTGWVFPSITTVTADALVALIGCRSNDLAGANFSAWTNANLANLTERFDNGSTTGNGGGIGMATGENATPDAVGTTSATTATSMRQGWVIAIRPSSTVSLTRSGTDSVSFSETVARVIGTARAGSESVTLSESESHTQGVTRTGTDSLTLSESGTRAAMSKTRSGTDSINLSESPAITGIGTHVSGTDSVSLSESVSHDQNGNLVRSGTDSITLSESVSKTLGLRKTGTDSITLSEVGSATGPPSPSSGSYLTLTYVGGVPQETP